MGKSKVGGKTGGKASSVTDAFGFQVENLLTDEQERRLELYADNIDAGMFPNVWPFIKPKPTE